MRQQRDCWSSSKPHRPPIFDLVSKEKTKDSLKLSNEYLRVFVEYMYAHFDAFKLILCRAEGTRYANFLEEFVELEVECSEEYYALLRKKRKALREK